MCRNISQCIETLFFIRLSFTSQMLLYFCWVPLYSFSIDVAFTFSIYLYIDISISCFSATLVKGWRWYCIWFYIKSQKMNIRHFSILRTLFTKRLDSYQILTANSLSEVVCKRWEFLTMRLCQPTPLTHWGRVTHICASKLSIVGSHNGLSPDRHQTIIWTNARILLIRTLGTNFSEILNEIQKFSFKKMHLKISSAKWRPFCLDLNVFMQSNALYRSIVV